MERPQARRSTGSEASLTSGGWERPRAEASHPVALGYAHSSWRLLEVDSVPNLCKHWYPLNQAASALQTFKEAKG